MTNTTRRALNGSNCSITSLGCPYYDAEPVMAYANDPDFAA